MKHTILGFKPYTDTDEQAEAAARAAMRDRIRQGGRVMKADTLMRGPERAVTLIDDGTDVTDWNGVGQPDGHMIEWSAESTEPIVDDGTPVGTIEKRGETDDGLPWVNIAMPDYVTEQGGGFRIRHDLGGEVTIVCYADGGTREMGYLFAHDIDENVSHVEVFAGVTHIGVQRDPDPEDAPAEEVIH